MGKIVTFTGTDGATHSIDLGVNAKGEARTRLSGADILRYLHTMAASGASADDVVAALGGTRGLSTAEEGARDERWDSVFAGMVESLRDTRATKSFLLSDLRKKAVATVGRHESWTVPDALEKASEVEAAFSDWAIAVSPDGGSFAKPVLRQRGQQTVVLASK